MTLLNIDFLAGTLTATCLIPPLVRLLSTGRFDGWSRAPQRKPPIGVPVLACVKGSRAVSCIVYRGPAAGEDIPENAELRWRPMPSAPNWRST